MRPLRLASALAVLAVLAACGSGVPPAGDGAGPGPAPDAGRGETLSLACQACHSLAAEGPHLVGPNLNGVFGRAAGQAAGFGSYSEALESADFVWTPERLDRWLEDPAGFLPGTSMAFTGYRSPADRAALIGYLVRVTAVDADSD